MKSLTKIKSALVLSLLSLSAMAQQAPMFTHYMYNTLEINPAYAGSRNAFTVTGLHRSQWVNFKGAPITQTLTMHTPLKNEHIGLGLSVINDKIGPVNNTAVNGSFAFIMNLNEKSKLALGLSAGATMFKANLSALQLDQQTDPVFQNNVNNKISPNFGFGAYFSRERFYAGVSAPGLVQNTYSVVNTADGKTLTAKEQRHYFLIAGAVFNLSENLAFKPTGFAKLTPGAPIQGDVTASFIILKKLLIGAMYRSGDAVGGLIGLDITEQFHVGYSYDWSFGLKTSQYNSGSHELVLRYDFLSKGEKQIHSPRYF